MKDKDATYWYWQWLRRNPDYIKNRNRYKTKQGNIVNTHFFLRRYGIWEVPDPNQEYPPDDLIWDEGPAKVALLDHEALKRGDEAAAYIERSPTMKPAIVVTINLLYSAGDIAKEVRRIVSKAKKLRRKEKWFKELVNDQELLDIWDAKERGQTKYAIRKSFYSDLDEETGKKRVDDRLKQAKERIESTTLEL